MKMIFRRRKNLYKTFPSGMKDDALYNINTEPQGKAVEIADFMKFINEDE